MRIAKKSIIRIKINKVVQYYFIYLYDGTLLGLSRYPKTARQRRYFNSMCNVFKFITVIGFVEVVKL